MYQLNCRIFFYFILHNIFQLRQNLEKMMGSSESSDVPCTRRRDVDDQVLAFRTLIRRKEYLVQPSDASVNPISLDGKLLSNDLLSFTEKLQAGVLPTLPDTWDCSKLRHLQRFVFALQKKNRKVLLLET